MLTSIQEVVAVVVGDFMNDEKKNKEIRLAIKNEFGHNNVARDFVPLDSTDPKIKRGVNSRSRKCSVMFKEREEDRD